MSERYDSDTGRAAALRRWAFTDDPVEATAKLRAGFLARFEREVDPDNQLAPDEREKRARRLMRAHMIDLARRSRAKRAAQKLARRPNRTS
jgi:hypothetical protein